MKKVLLAIAVLLSAFSGADFANAKSLPTAWNPPALSNPIIIDLNTKPSSWSGQRIYSKRDVLVIGKTSGSRPGFTIASSANPNRIIVMGGKYTSRITIRGFYREIYLEGVHVNNGGQINDGLVACGALKSGAPNHPVYGRYGTGRPRVVFQNVIVEGIQGNNAAYHADIYQPQGKVGSLRIYNFTGKSGHQGFMIDEGNLTGINHWVGVWLQRVNLRHINHHNHASALWHRALNPSHKVWTKDVYITQKSGTTFQNQSITPGVHVAGSGVWHASQNMVTLNKVIGSYKDVIKGTPPGGDFVKSWQIGANYWNTSVPRP